MLTHLDILKAIPFKKMMYRTTLQDLIEAEIRSRFPGADQSTKDIHAYLLANILRILPTDSLVTREIVDKVLVASAMPPKIEWFGLRTLVYYHRRHVLEDNVFKPVWSLRQAVICNAVPSGPTRDWLIAGPWENLDPTWAGLRNRILILLIDRKPPDNTYEQMFRFHQLNYKPLEIK